MGQLRNTLKSKAKAKLETIEALRKGKDTMRYRRGRERKEWNYLSFQE